MNIYKISQKENNNYDTYDSAIVIANSEEEAKKIHPDECIMDNKESYKRWLDGEGMSGTWVNLYSDNPEYNVFSAIKVELLGAAKEGSEYGVVLASYNAG